MNVGDVILFNIKTIHGSSLNNSKYFRCRFVPHRTLRPANALELDTRTDGKSGTCFSLNITKDTESKAEMVKAEMSMSTII